LGVHGEPECIALCVAWNLLGGATRMPVDGL